MYPRFPSLLSACLLVAVTALSAPSLSAQVPGLDTGDRTSKETEAADRERQEQIDNIERKIDSLEHSGASEAEVERQKQLLERLVGEGLERARKDPNAPRRGLERYASVNVGHVPRRVAPGASGELQLIVALRGEHVLQENPELLLLYGRNQGVLTLGEWRLEPAGPGRLYEEWEGQNVYDNTATIVIPFQVDPEAEYGKYPVSFSPTFPITHARSQKLMGMFAGSASGTVKVGPPLPVVKIPDMTEPETAPAAALTATDLSAKPTEAASGTGRAPIEAANLADADPAPVNASSRGGEDVAPGPALPQDDSSLMTYGLAGLGLLIVVGLLAMRRR